jgi:hypothetical protein
MDTAKKLGSLKANSTALNIPMWSETKNQVADALSKLGSSRAQVPHGIFIQDLLNTIN